MKIKRDTHRSLIVDNGNSSSVPRTHFQGSLSASPREVDFNERPERCDVQITNEGVSSVYTFTEHGVSGSRNVSFFKQS